MTRGIYSYRDNKTSFGQIWYDYSDESAKRGFAMMMTNSDGIMGFSPADFDLFKIGEFDTETGQIDPRWPIEWLMNGRAAVLEKESENIEE